MIVNSDLSIQAIEHFGLPNQILKCIEELHELSEALMEIIKPLNNTEHARVCEIIRRLRYNKDTIKTGIKTCYTDIDEETRLAISMEIADVLIMIRQVNLILGNSPDEIANCIQSKEDRLRERMV